MTAHHRTMDNDTMTPGTIQTTTSGTVYAGESATRLFQIRTVIRMLELEMRYPGMKISRIGAMPIAKKLTGLNVRNRQVLIDALKVKATELEQNVTVIP